MSKCGHADGSCARSFLSFDRGRRHAEEQSETVTRKRQGFRGIQEPVGISSDRVAGALFPLRAPRKEGQVYQRGPISDPYAPSYIPNPRMRWRGTTLGPGDSRNLPSFAVRGNMSVAVTSRTRPRKLRCGAAVPQRSEDSQAMILLRIRTSQHFTLKQNEKVLYCTCMESSDPLADGRSRRAATQGGITKREIGRAHV